MSTNREYLMKRPDEMLAAISTNESLCSYFDIYSWRTKQSEGCISMSCGDCISEWLASERKETIKDIEKDAIKLLDDYWNCKDISCLECPHDIKPKEQYDVLNCTDAQKLDIIARCEAALKQW